MKKKSDSIRPHQDSTPTIRRFFAVGFDQDGRWADVMMTRAFSEDIALKDNGVDWSPITQIKLWWDDLPKEYSHATFIGHLNCETGKVFGIVLTVRKDSPLNNSQDDLKKLLYEQVREALMYLPGRLARQKAEIATCVESAKQNPYQYVDMSPEGVTICDPTSEPGKEN